MSIKWKFDVCRDMGYETHTLVVNGIYGGYVVFNPHNGCYSAVDKDDGDMIEVATLEAGKKLLTEQIF